MHRVLEPKAETIFGYRAGEIVGRSLVRLLPRRDRRVDAARFGARAAARAARRAGRTIELSGRCKDGREFPMELSLSKWSTTHGRYVTGMIRDQQALEPPPRGRRRGRSERRIGSSRLETLRAHTHRDLSRAARAERAERRTIDTSVHWT